MKNKKNKKSKKINKIDLEKLPTSTKVAVIAGFVVVLVLCSILGFNIGQWFYDFAN